MTPARHRRYAALALAAATLAGCDPAPEPPGRTAPAASASRRPLADALLTPADVPSGYAPAPRPTSTEVYESQPKQCGAAFDALEIDVASGPGVDEARANFATPGDFSRIQHIVRRYDQGSRAALTTARNTVEDCSRFVLTYPDSTQFEITTKVVRANEDGFDAAVHLQAAAFAVEELLLIRAVDDILVIISYTAPEAPDPAVAEELMAAAAEKLQAR